MSIQFNTTNYSQLNSDITEIMRAGTYSGVSISIYTDADATIFAVDGNAPLENKKISKLNTTGSYTITATNQFINASLEVVFDDGSSFKSFDNVDEYWYKIEGVVFNRRKF
jgi:type 1 fimbria pilin